MALREYHTDWVKLTIHVPGEVREKMDYLIKRRKFDTISQMSRLAIQEFLERYDAAVAAKEAEKLKQEEERLAKETNQESNHE